MKTGGAVAGHAHHFALRIAEAMQATDVAGTPVAGPVREPRLESEGGES